MAHFSPIHPSDASAWLSPPAKKTAQNLTFAIILIVALAAVITGVLGVYKIDFFAGLGTHVSQGLALGGGALGVTAIIAYVASLCACREKPEGVPHIQEPQSEPQPSPKKKFVIKPRPPEEAKLPIPIKPKEPQSQPPPPPNVATNPTDIPITLAPTPEPVPQAPTEIKPLPPPQLKVPTPLHPLTWQPLVELQKKRNQADIYAPSTGSVLLKDLRRELPLPQQILGPIRTAQGHFVKKMEEIYRGLIKGELKIVIDCREVTLKENGYPPIHMVIEARRFITEHIEAFNALLTQKQAPQLLIDIDAFFEVFSAEDRKLMPDWRLASHKNVFVQNLKLELNALFQSGGESGLELSHFAQVEAYMVHEVGKFNAEMHAFIQDPAHSSLSYEDVPSEVLDPVLQSMKRLFSLWSRMEGISSFEGAVDAKIEAFENLCTDLPEADEALWAEYPIFKPLIIQSFYSLSKGFFINHKFWMNNEDDVTRKVQAQSTIAEIARKLEVPPPQIELKMEVENDELLAATWAHQLQDEERQRQIQLGEAAARRLAATGHFG